MPIVKLGAPSCALAGLFFIGPLVTIAESLSQQTPTISLKVVKVNPVCVGGDADGEQCIRDCDCPGGVCGGDISPTDQVVAQPGDRFLIELFASQWSPTVSDPERLLGWQVLIDLNALTNTWQKELNVVTGPRCCMPEVPFFSSHYACEDLGRHLPCEPDFTGGTCDGTGSDSRAAGAFIDRSRSDYVFFARDDLVITDLSDPTAIKFAGILTDSRNAVAFNSAETPRYLASIALEVPSEACGSFYIVPTQGTMNTALYDVDLEPIVDPQIGELELDGVTVMAGNCPCATIRSSVPDHCSLDARQPTALDNSNQNLNRLSLETGCSPSDAILLANPDYFIVTTEGVGSNVPSISSVSPGGPGPNGGYFIDISFAPGNLSPGAWNCIQIDPPGPGSPGNRYCFGVLPGDTNADSVTERADLTALNDCIMNPGSCPLQSCDFDRSGECAPADRLRLVDLLAGAGPYAVWEGKGIVDQDGVPITCPSISP